MALRSLLRRSSSSCPSRAEHVARAKKLEAKGFRTLGCHACVWNAPPPTTQSRLSGPPGQTGRSPVFFPGLALAAQNLTVSINAPQLLPNREINRAPRFRYSRFQDRLTKTQTDFVRRDLGSLLSWCWSRQQRSFGPK